MPLKGSAEVTVALTAAQGQSADVKLEATGLSLGEGQERIAMRRLSLTAKGHNLLATALGQADLAVSEVAAGNLRLGHVTAKLARSTPAALTFSAETKGTYRLPEAAPEQQSLALALDLGGIWRGAGRSQEFVLDRLTASLAGDSARLQRPLHLAFGGGNARMEDLALDLAGGSVTGSGALEADRLRASLVVRALPLKPFAHLAGQDASGTIDATAELDGPASAAAGHVTLRGHGLKFMGLGSTAAQLPPLDLELALAPAAGQLQLDGKISAKGDQLIAANGTVPLLLSARPFAVAVPQAGRLALDLAGDGKLEKLAQILPMGEDRITGDYRVALAVGRHAGPAGYGRQRHDRQCQLSQPGLRDGAARPRPRADRQSKPAAADPSCRPRQQIGHAGRVGRSRFRRRLATPRLPGEADQFPGRQQRRGQGARRCRYPAPAARCDAPKLYGRLTLRRSDFRIPDQLPPSIANLDVVEIDSRDPARTRRRSRCRGAGQAAGSRRCPSRWMWR